MGEAKLRRAKFFEDHPLCCFCGGDQAAKEEDHQPARVFFSNRVWPEGFVFPACERCNRASKESENALALLAAPQNDEIRADYQKRVAWAWRNSPNLLNKLHSLTTRDKRNVARRLGLPLPPGTTFSDLPIVKLNKDIWQPHLDMIGRKLALALWYQSFSRPLAHAGSISIWSFTNSDALAHQLPPEVTELMPSLVIPRRASVSLGDQFLVKYGATEEGGAAYLISLHHRIFFLLVVIETNEEPDEDISGRTFRPFRWSD